MTGHHSKVIPCKPITKLPNYLGFCLQAWLHEDLPLLEVHGLFEDLTPSRGLRQACIIGKYSYLYRRSPIESQGIQITDQHC